MIIIIIINYYYYYYYYLKYLGSIITKWFFLLQLKSENENAKSIYLLFIKKKLYKKIFPLKVRIKIKIEL